jgi:organic radical activating enzyme
MLFLRLAGCNVGRYKEQLNGETYIQKQDFPLLAAGTHSICETVDGQRFLCDTDYHEANNLHRQSLVDVISEVMTAGQSPEMEAFNAERKRSGFGPVATQQILRICITGGEPLLHKEKLLQECRNISAAFPHIEIHMETSGTLPIYDRALNWVDWVTCSPKKGFLPTNADRIDEYKVLCGEHFKMEELPEEVLEAGNRGIPVYLQPIQGVHETDQVAFERCLAILKVRPEWRLSAQLHKFLKLR